MALSFLPHETGSQVGNLRSRLRWHIKQLLGRALRLMLWSLAAMLSEVLDQSFSRFDLNA